MVESIRDHVMEHIMMVMRMNEDGINKKSHCVCIDGEK